MNSHVYRYVCCVNLVAALSSDIEPQMAPCSLLSALFLTGALWDVSSMKSELWLHLKWHPILYIVNFRTLVLWSKVVHCIGNRVPFGTQIGCHFVHWE